MRDSVSDVSADLSADATSGSVDSSLSSAVSESNWIRLCSSDDAAAATNVALSLDNRGLAYADGFFTTIGVIDGQVLWSEYHLQRLDSHADALQLALDSQALLAILQIHAQQLQQGMLKLVVTRAAQDIRGYGYSPNAAGSACEIWLKASAMTVATAETLRLAEGRFIPLQPSSAAICLTSQLACLPPPLAGLKSLNRLDNVLASGELQRIKAQASSPNFVQADFLKNTHSQTSAESTISEGLLRDMSGHWIEGTMSNVFYQLSELPHSSASSNTFGINSNHATGNEHNADYLSTGQWYTPSMAQSGVAGVMRQVLIDELSTSKNPAIIRSLSDEDLPRITQLFFCNALRGIMPMNSLTLLSGEVVSF